MKLRIQQLGLVIVSTLTIHTSFAQTWQEDASGIYPTSLGKYVGINTNTPGAALDVENSILMGINSPAYGVRIKTNLPGYSGGWARGLWIVNEDNTKNYFSLGVLGSVTAGVTNMSYAWLGKSYDDAAMYFLPNGNVGIGTTTPQAKLHINGSLQIANQWLTEYANNTLGIGHGSNGSGLYIGALAVGYDYGSLGSSVDRSGNVFIAGNMGIGTTKPTAKLEVKGTIKAKQVTVTQNGWADYVFDKNYKLMPLKDLYTYIQQHKHLPEIPTTNEIEKNGVDVGTNQALLLKKIEELTLYIIEQQKQIAEQNQKIFVQNERIQKLENI